MGFHKELYSDLPPADELREKYASFLASAKQADGYYDLVQQIAHVYGDRAYEIAAEVFEEEGMEFDPVALRTPNTVRRVGYAFDGINIYDLDVRPFQLGAVPDVLRIYNRLVRELSPMALLDQSSFMERIWDNGRLLKDGFFLVYNRDDNILGFVHCCIDRSGDSQIGSVEALFFLPGRAHVHVGGCLIGQAREYFRINGIEVQSALQHRRDYPFYQVTGTNAARAFSRKLGHIYETLQRL
jgi:hypothetical protein